MTAGRAPGRVGTWVQSWREEPLRAVALRARVQRPRRNRQFAHFGAESILHRPAWVYGAHKATIGDGCILLTGMWLAVERQAWSAPDPVLRIGNRVGARPWCTVSAAASVVLEDDVILSACVSIVDSEHTFRGDNPNTLYNPLDVAPVRVGRGTLVGANAVILAGSDIGEHCIIGAGSVVRGTIPDHSIAVGAPARVVGSTRDKGAGSFRSDPMLPGAP